MGIQQEKKEVDDVHDWSNESLYVFGLCVEWNEVKWFIFVLGLRIELIEEYVRWGDVYYREI